MSYVNPRTRAFWKGRIEYYINKYSQSNVIDSVYVPTTVLCFGGPKHRAVKAVQVYKQLESFQPSKPVLILSGTKEQRLRNYKLALDAGINSNSIFLIAANSTYEELEKASMYLGNHFSFLPTRPTKNVVLVTSRFHMSRCEQLTKAFDFNIVGLVVSDLKGKGIKYLHAETEKTVRDLKRANSRFNFFKIFWNWLSW